ncbi:hypothetical protein EEL30_14650 [Brevibacillus laterosporus]|uniref:Uncharacterized protein n=1 Tax=Brevibacillus laterosporus TaxID=1465 RepID=A0A518V8W4_BRELA|nr:hypothetical protein EEL30_14650 [Brevibacillus laterosporus]
MKKSKVIKSVFVLTATFILSSPINFVGTVKAADAGIDGKSFAENILQLDEQELKEDATSLTNQVDRMTDEEFDKFIVTFTKEFKGTPDEAKQELSLLDIEYSTKEVEHSSIASSKKAEHPSVASSDLEAADLEFSITQSKRGKDSFYRLISTFGAKYAVFDHGSYDLVSIEWDPDVASYYEAVVGDEKRASLRDGSKRKQGIYMFNVYDYREDFDTYAAVYVEPKVKGKWLEYGSKYTHTYVTKGSGSSGQASFEFGRGSIGTSLSYTVNPSSSESSWEKWDDGAVKF